MCQDTDPQLVLCVKGRSDTLPWYGSIFWTGSSTLPTILRDSPPMVCPAGMALLPNRDPCRKWAHIRYPVMLWVWPDPVGPASKISPASSPWRSVYRRGPPFPDSRCGHSLLLRSIHGGLGIASSGLSPGSNLPRGTLPGATCLWQHGF